MNCSSGGLKSDNTCLRRDQDVEKSSHPYSKAMITKVDEEKWRTKSEDFVIIRGGFKEYFFSQSN